MLSAVAVAAVEEVVVAPLHLQPVVLLHLQLAGLEEVVAVRPEQQEVVVVRKLPIRRLAEITYRTFPRSPTMERQRVRRQP